MAKPAKKADNASTKSSTKSFKSLKASATSALKTIKRKAVDIVSPKKKAKKGKDVPTDDMSIASDEMLNTSGSHKRQPSEVIDVDDSSTDNDGPDVEDSDAELSKSSFTRTTNELT